MATKKEAKAISGVPGGPVSSLSGIEVTRSDNTGNLRGSVTWKVPKWHTDDQNPTRAERLQWFWDFFEATDLTPKKAGHIFKILHKTGMGTGNEKCHTGVIKRNKYYPFTHKVKQTVYKKNKNGTYKLDKKGNKIPETKKVKGKTVTVTKTVHKVYPMIEGMHFSINETNSWNKNGSNGVGPIDVKYHEFKKPDTPKVSFELEDGNVLKITIKSNTGVTKERYDVVYHVMRRDTNTGSIRYEKFDKKDNRQWVTALSYPGGTELKKGAVKPFKAGSTSKETVLRHDLNFSQIPTNAKIDIKVVCYARGIRGNSAHAGGNPKKIKGKKGVGGLVWKDSDYPGVTYQFKPPTRPIINAIQVTKGKNFPNSGYSSDPVASYIGLGQVLVWYEEWGKSSAKEYAKGPTSVELYRTVVPEDIDTSAKMISYAGANWTKVDEDNGVFSSTKKATDYADEGCMGELCSDVISAFTQRSSGTYYGERVWYKIKAIRQGMELESAPVEAVEFYRSTPTMSRDKCEFLLMESGSDGTSIDLQIGWDDGSSDKEMVNKYPNGTFDTEISWATDERTWHSSNTPSTGTIDWENSASKHTEVMNKSEVKTKDWKKSADFSIMDLTPGEDYYLKGRRHVKMDDIDEYGPYCKPAEIYWPFTVFKLAGSISVNVPPYMLYEGTLAVSWSIDSDDLLKDWCVYAGSAKTPKTVVAPVSKNGYSKDATYAEIDYADLLNKGVISQDSDGFYLAVGVSIDGTTMVRSDQKASSDDEVVRHWVDIIRYPDGAVSVPSTVTAQPAAFVIFSDRADTEAPVAIRSLGINMLFPDGVKYQPEGDFVWEALVGQSAWGDSGEVVADYASQYTWEMDSDLAALAAEYPFAAIVVPGIQEDMYDGCRYTVEYSIRDANHRELSYSPDDYPVFQTDYEHKAEQPGIASQVVSMSKKNGSPYVSIMCAPPENFEPDDVCDIYRGTPDGSVLVARDVPFGTTVYDEYPAFGKKPRTFYTLMTRTVDGSYAYRRIRYYIPKFGIRFDWGSGLSAGYLELPYNVTLSDSFTKDSEVRSHLSGRRSAFFNKGVQRTGSASAAEPITIEHIDPEQFERLREMAQHPGLVLFRAENGVCYNAVVNVGDIPYSYDSLISSISLDLEAVDLADQFMIDLGNSLEMLAYDEEEVEDEG